MIKSKFPKNSARAIIKHKCCNCYQIIEPGTSYNHQKYIQYGKFGVNKWHENCSKFGQLVIKFKEWWQG